MFRNRSEMFSLNCEVLNVQCSVFRVECTEYGGWFAVCSNSCTSTYCSRAAVLKFYSSPFAAMNALSLYPGFNPDPVPAPATAPALIV